MLFPGQALQNAVWKRVCKQYRLIFTLANAKIFFAQLVNNLHNSAESNKSLSPFSKGFF